MTRSKKVKPGSKIFWITSRYSPDSRWRPAALTVIKVKDNIIYTTHEGADPESNECLKGPSLPISERGMSWFITLSGANFECRALNEKYDGKPEKTKTKAEARRQFHKSVVDNIYRG